MSKLAVITGASRGIGYETGLSLAKHACNVMAVARSEDKLKTLQSQYPNYINYFPADLTHQSHLAELVEHLSGKTKGVDILINNAGALVNKPFTALTKEDWQHMLDANLMSVINVTRAMLPLLNTDSHIVNISSMGGFQGSDKFPGLTAYSVAKGAVSILSECLAAEFADKGIYVNALCLGSVQTGMFETAFPDFSADVSPDKMGTYIADFALNGSTFYNGRVLPVALSRPS